MNKIIIYMDNCCFNRPYDDQNYLSIYLETQAKLVIQELVKDKDVALAWSFILDFENGANPDEIVKKEIFTWRKISTLMINKSKKIVDKAKEFMKLGLDNKDALHLASAIDGEVNFFITVDKGILRKRDLIKNIFLYSPIEFIDYIEENNNEI